MPVLFICFKYLSKKRICVKKPGKRARSEEKAHKSPFYGAWTSPPSHGIFHAPHQPSIPLFKAMAFVMNLMAFAMNAQCRKIRKPTCSVFIHFLTSSP